MNTAIIAKDTMLLRREPLLKALLAAVALLLAVSVLTGVQRERVFDKERASAEQTDREVWLGQGERNPHSAAHFSRYAFRPSSALAVFDPGISDFAGLAVWMEAHYQNPAEFRRAEDASELSRYVQLSPAFLLLTAAPLLVIVMLHGSIAGEREDGTLRQLLASGVSGREFFAAKFFSGWRIAIGACSGIFLLLAAVAVFSSPGGLGPDAALRMLLLYLVYAAYVTVWVTIAIAGSALCATRRWALASLTGVWILMALVAPRLGSALATALHPHPDAQAVAGELRAASDLWWGDEDRKEQFRRNLLEEYEVSDVSALPFDYGAYTLQVSEELSNPAFDRIYAQLEIRYRAQDRVLTAFSLISPAIVTATLSRALAGTDRVHQQAFTAAAETHRRTNVRMLNEDFMHNAGGAGYGYTADRALWEQFEDFVYRPPAFAAVAGRFAVDAIILMAWLGGAWWVAAALVGWTVRREATRA